jgi:hypothetical protein
LSGFERWCRGGGYANKIDSSLLGWAKERLGLLVETIKRNDDIKDFQVLSRRWVTERTFGWLIRNRAWLATTSD